MSITWVTAFYDLGSLESNSQRRNKEEYLKNGEFVLSYNINLVIYCSPEDAEYFTSRRDYYGFTNKTLIIPKSFTSLPYYKYKNIMTRAWLQYPPVFPHKLTMSYSQLMWCKTEMVGDTMITNPFQTSHFGWIDFGLAHFTKMAYKPDLNKIQSDKIRMMQINYFSPSSVRMGSEQEKRHQYCNILDHIAGTIFTGRADYIERYCLLFTKFVMKALNDGFVPTDEPLIPLIINNYPDMFELYYGDFGCLLKNYEQPRDGVDKMLRVFHGAISENNMEKMNHILSHMIKLDYGEDYHTWENILYEAIKVTKSLTYIDMYKEDVKIRGFHACYYAHKSEVDRLLTSVGVNATDGNYGYDLIITNDDECSVMMRKYFEEFVKLQEIANIITGCGTYLIDGQTTLDYYPAQYSKQSLLFNHSKGKKRVLDIGIYAGHTGWLMLLANIDNPQFHYVGLDMGSMAFTEPCIKLLQTLYPDRVTYLKGELDSITNFEEYDLVHFNCFSDDKIVANTNTVLNDVKPTTTVIFNNYDFPGAQNAFQCHGQRVDIVGVSEGPYRNCVVVKK